MKFIRRKSGEEGAGDAPKDSVKKSRLRQRGNAPAAVKNKPTKPKSGKGQKFVLVIGDEGAILIFIQGKKVVRRLFAPSPQPDHTATIVELMQGNPKVPVFLLADVLDQQYVRHSFPPVSALSVGGLVKRRLDRDFQPEDLKGSLPLGRDKTGRKEWNFLLISLANTPLIQQWVELVVEQPNEFKGVFLTPVEGQNYLPMLKKALPVPTPAVPWQLLVSHNKISGFRQIVLRDGKLVFTRVTQAIDDALAAVIAGNIEQEILNTLEYLRRLGFQENATLEMIVIAAQEVKEALDVKRFNTAAANVLTPFEVAEILGLEQAALSADRFGDVVMASAFAISKKHILPFMSAYGKRLSQLYLVRRGVIVLAALAALTLGFYIIDDVIQAISDSAAASDTIDRRKPLETQLASIRKSINGLDLDVAYKAAIVSAYDAYVRDRKNPVDFLNDLAPQLSREERVISFLWEVRTPSATVPTNNSGGNVSSSPLQATVTIEFDHPYEDVEALSRGVTEYIATLKQKMPQYDIGTGAFPWMSNTQQGMEISFNQEGKAGLHEGMNKIDFYFWPKAEAPKPPEAKPGGPPGAAPAGVPGGHP